MQRTDLVTGRIAQVGEIESARGPFAPAGRVLDALAAIGDAGIMEGLRLLGTVAREADGAAVGVCRHVAIDRLGEGEHTGLGAIKDAALWIGFALRQAD